MGEAIQGIPLIRAYAAEEWLQSRFESEVEMHRRAKYKTLRLLALQHPVVGFIEATGILTVLAIGAIRISNGGLDSQGFSSYVAALLMLIDPISHLTINFNEYQQGQASLNRLYEIYDEKNELRDSESAKKLQSTIGELQLKDITFNYVNDKNVFSNLNLYIPSGKVFALVGPSGAGKSTLFSLLLRFNIPNKGCILFDGHNISKLQVKQIRENIALVPQRITIFSGTIYDAIRFGRNISEEEIIEAAKISNAHKFIMQMPNNYQSRLEERGANISGGQLQRLAIARAILGNPKVLLLDEATSALDAESEAEVQLGLKQAMKGRTVIIIAHRLSTVQEADQIVFLEEGKIIESGNHNELIKLEGRYKDLCDRQLIRVNQS